MSTPKSQMTAKDIRAFFKEIKLFNDLKLRGFQISVTQGRGTAHSWVSITLTSSKKHEQYVESIIRDLIEKLLRTKFQKILPRIIRIMESTMTLLRVYPSVLGQNKA